jgi:hypothetical protein
MCTMSEQIQDLAAALVKAQAEMGHASKDAKNPHFRSDYATLASVIEATRPTLSKHGLSVLQPVTNDEHGNVVVETIILHTSGQWMKSRLACKPAKNDAQGIGSVTTYLRRYSLAAVCGVAQADDDGESASGRGESKGPQMAPAPQAKAPPKQATKGAPSFEIQAESMEKWVEKFLAWIARAPDVATMDKVCAANDGHLKALPDEVYKTTIQPAIESRMGELQVAA